MISVVIAGTTYNIPTNGQSPPWGSDLTDLLEAIVSLTNSLSGSADILTTSFSLNNNQSSPANVVGLAFGTSTVRSAIISYSLYRTTSSEELSEAGQIYITYKSSLGSFEIAQYNVGSSDIKFTITASGQVQYTSNNLSGTSHSCKMKFSARSFLQN